MAEKEEAIKVAVSLHREDSSRLLVTYLYLVLDVGWWADMQGPPRSCLDAVCSLSRDSLLQGTPGRRDRGLSISCPVSQGTHSPLPPPQPLANGAAPSSVRTYPEKARGVAAFFGSYPSSTCPRMAFAPCGEALL